MSQLSVVSIMLRLTNVLKSSSPRGTFSPDSYKMSAGISIESLNVTKYPPVPSLPDL